MMKANRITVVVLGQDCSLAPNQSITVKELLRIAEVFSQAAKILKDSRHYPHGVVRAETKGDGLLAEIGFDDGRMEWDEDQGLPLLKQV